MATAKKAAKKAAKKVASVVSAVAPRKPVAVAPVRKMEQKLINHIVFALDSSGSMYNLENAVIEVFDAQIKALAEASVEMDQETRVSIYTFDNEVKCLIYDTDVLRLSTIRGTYRNTNGGTALLDATAKTIEDLKLTPELYGDHAFLLYVLTDGAEMHSYRTTAAKLANTINNLPDNWTMAAMVPNESGKRNAEHYGFPSDNIVIWDTSAKGISDLGARTKTVTRSYMTARASGVRATKGLFQIKQVSGAQVKANLEPLKGKEYLTINVRKDGPIKETIEAWTGEGYRSGSGYYQLTKKETIQAYKNVLVKETRTGKVYGGSAARQLLGLPNHEVKVEKGHLAGYEIFVQSTSNNRKLIGGTELIVML